MDRLPPTDPPVPSAATPSSPASPLLGAPDAGAPDFGSELRRLRTERGLSLSALSRQLHYSKGYLSKIENGSKPAGSDLARRCDRLLDAGGALLKLADPALPCTPLDAPTGAVAAPAAAAPEPAPPCPYLGLAAFGPQDARWFAGRAAAVHLLVERLAERVGQGPLVLAAPSGAGKSSLLRAGLLPAVRSGALPGAHGATRRAVVCTPTARPLDALRRALAGARADPPGCSAGAPAAAPADSGLVLVVDQFEEVFTLCPDPAERRGFIQALCELAGRPGPTPISVVLGVRADFCGRCLDHPELVPVFSRGLLALGPMTAAELHQAITRPAAEAGLLLEPGLVEILLRDLGLADIPHPTTSPERPAAPAAAPLGSAVPAGSGDSASGIPLGPDAPPDPSDSPDLAGVLPLLSHALLATWQQREGRTLTVAGYLRTGGVRGAIAATAERLFAGLTDEGRQTARRLLLRLVHVSTDSEPTRHPVPLDHLRAAAEPFGTDPITARAVAATAAPTGSADVLDAFVQSRLLTVDSRHVLITHDALLRAWPRLRTWLHADRAGLLVRQQLAEAAAEWERADRDPGLLYQGTRLAVATEQLGDPRRRAQLTSTENAFLTAAQQQAADRERAARRQLRRRRQLLVTLLVLLVLAISAGGVAYRQRVDADAGRRSALSKALAAESASLAAGRPEASMLLADSAFRTAPTTEARSALLSTQSQAFAGRLFGHTGPVNAVAFSPDSTHLATASSDGTLKIWRVSDRQLVTTLTGHGGSVRAVAFSPDGSLLASGSTDGTVRLWDLAGRRLPVTLFGNGGGVRSVAFSPDGRTLVSGGADRTVRLWDLTSHTLLAALTGHTDEIQAVAYSPDGHLVASAAADRTIRLWDTAARTPVGVLTGHSDEVLGVAFSPDGRTLASASADRTIRLWDTASGASIATLTGHSDDVNGVAYTDGGATLVSASGDGTVRLWDLATRRITATLCGHTDYVQGVAVSPDGQVIATAGFDQTAALWRPGAAALTVHPFTEIWQTAYSPDGRTVAAADAGHTVRLWDVGRHTLAGTLDGHVGSVFGIAFSPDGRLLASAGADETIRLWDLATRTQLAVLTGHQGSVFAVAFSPDGHLLVSAGEDRTVRLWDVRSRRAAGVLAGHTDFVNTVAFSPDGRTIASGSDDLTVRLWDVAGQRLTATLTGHTGSVRAVAFSPDGRALASAGNDGTVRLWAPAEQRLTATLTGHTGSVRGIAFAPDGRTLASAGNDGTVRLWDARNRSLTATLTGHTDAVWSVAFSPDGRALASSGSDGTVRLWDSSTQDRSNGICRLLGALGPEQWSRLVPDQPYRPGC
ncbi:helix-turn-helix domain-containing protein [Kitasatospora sp. LaBMicrA B282]|uniref:nSTAND1 domain-containing NTPase n=1 Tax=Kitasatospora sp. LaBMicrA B282 TaxID=3420949 RepID=UPI003D12CF70